MTASGKLKVAAIVGGAVAVVGTVVIVANLAFTPTITLHIKNDSLQAVQVTSCGSDPVLLTAGDTGSIDPNPNDPHAVCFVYSAAPTSYLGCLSIPTTLYKDGDTIRLSSIDQKIPESKCGR